MRNPSIAILTDFGHRDHYVGVMKGVIATLAPRISVIDLTHGIPAGQIAIGAIALAQSWRFFPPDTIFLAVVDPGVGTARRPVAITTQAGARFVGPDNGLLWMAAKAAGVKAMVELRTPRYRLETTAATFHGRDIFAPAAAALARRVRLDALGPRLDQIIELDAAGSVIETADELRGEIIYVDGFGNLVTNIARAQFNRFAARCPQGTLSLAIQRYADLPIHATYGAAAVGAPLALFGSFEMLEIAVREGSAASHLGVGIGAQVRVKSTIKP